MDLVKAFDIIATRVQQQKEIEQANAIPPLQQWIEKPVWAKQQVQTLIRKYPDPFKLWHHAWKWAEKQGNAGTPVEWIEACLGVLEDEFRTVHNCPTINSLVDKEIYELNG